ncbi:MAG: hypothetical protein ACE5I7_12550 [Candidatus Binatia bacterium]
MPGAGFYSIHTSKLAFRSDGRWYADGEPVTHEGVARLFSRHVRRKASGGYEIWIDERYHADVAIEDTPFVVTAVDGNATAGLSVQLNDGTTELLDPASLHVGDGNVVYCRVKNGGEGARLLRPAYYQLARFIEETAPGRFQLRCGGAIYPITTV